MCPRHGRCLSYLEGNWVEGSGRLAGLAMTWETGLGKCPKPRTLQSRQEHLAGRARDHITPHLQLPPAPDGRQPANLTTTWEPYGPDESSYFSRNLLSRRSNRCGSSKCGIWCLNHPTGTRHMGKLTLTENPSTATGSFVPICRWALDTQVLGNSQVREIFWTPKS